jgi:hypothetical protein
MSDDCSYLFNRLRQECRRVFPRCFADTARVALNLGDENLSFFCVDYSVNAAEKVHAW